MGRWKKDLSVEVYDRPLVQKGTHLLETRIMLHPLHQEPKALPKERLAGIAPLPKYLSQPLQKSFPWAFLSPVSLCQ